MKRFFIVLLFSLLAAGAFAQSATLRLSQVPPALLDDVIVNALSTPGVKSEHLDYSKALTGGYPAAARFLLRLVIKEIKPQADGTGVYVGFAYPPNGEMVLVYVRQLSPFVAVNRSAYSFCQYLKTIEVTGTALVTGEQKKAQAPVFASELFGARMVNDLTPPRT